MILSPVAKTATAAAVGRTAFSAVAAASSTASSSVAVAVLRGGAQQALDLTRAKIRIEGLTSYGVIAALLMNAGLRLYSSTPKNLEFGKRNENVAKLIFCASMVVSICSGLYTTVIFSLLGLYSKTALGLGHDEPYLQFMASTATERQWAFDTFLISLVTFEVAFTSSLFINYKNRNTRWIATGIASVFALTSFWHWKYIMNLATKLMFSKMGH